MKELLVVATLLVAVGWADAQSPASQLSRGCVPQWEASIAINVQFRGDRCPEKNSTNAFLDAVDERLDRELRDEDYMLVDAVVRCRYKLIRASCEDPKPGQRRGEVTYKATFSCGDPCLRSRNFRNYIAHYSDGRNYLQIPKRHKEKFTIVFGDATLWVEVNSGRRSKSVQVCQTDELQFDRRNFVLCECPDECPDVCELPPQRGGPCQAVVSRFFHNSTSGECEPFIYSGCGGNQNNFRTRAECRAECPATRVCPSGKVYQQCGSGCPRTCANAGELVFCTRQCAPGCFCPEGTVEMGDTCVRPEECPTTRVCPSGKVYQQCGSGCPRTCANAGELVFCTRQCAPGCFCPEGTVEMGDTCVRPEECPRQCPDGKEYRVCGTACPDTCDNKDELRICTLNCVADCFCLAGTVEMGDECMAPEDCPSNRTECPSGKVYDECGSACPQSCDNTGEPIPCTKQCVAGCFCAEETVEMGETCVRPEECPGSNDSAGSVGPASSAGTRWVQCPAGKEYRECGSACPQTCANKDELQICPFICVADCFCPAGMVEMGDDCVAPENCPSNSTECPPGKTFSECATACPRTCDNRDDLTICTLQCRRGCVCPSSMVENEDTCVALEDCPTSDDDENPE